MALNTGKILMRRGQEANFDPSKMMPGEWAVSLDSRYVRMCFSPGVCVRMATYEAFEADMGQIRQILAECQTVEEAVQRIYDEIKDVAVDVERIELAAENALRSEEVASNSADVAIAAAEAAIKKAEEAADSESTASEKAQEAVDAAGTATQKASEAAESADNVRNMSSLSQSYAVGGTGTREGEDTDNAKYYNQQASDNADRAEAAAERAAAVADVGVATTEKAGIVKPDGTTVTVDPDGTIHVKEGTKNYNDLENKPQIGGVELTGDQTPDELGLVGKTDFEEFSSQTTEAVESLETGLKRTTFKVDTIIEKADLGIKETVSGERIYLDDSADAKVVEFGLYGKAKQKTTTGRQLIPYPFYEGTKTINGVTFTDNGDGTVKANGTNSSEDGYAFMNLIAGTDSANVIKSLGAGSYVLNGCPNGGSAGSYRIMFTINIGGSWSTKAIDYGSGAAFELTDDEIANITEANVNIRVYGTVNNSTFYPMIRLSSISDGAWEPYTDGIPSPSPEYPQEIEVAGASYNLLKYPYYESSHEDNGVSWADTIGTITANGTATSTSMMLYSFRTERMKAGKYILSGCPSGGSRQTYYQWFGLWDGSANVYGVYDIGNGIEVEVTEEQAENCTIVVAGYVYSGYKAENLTFKPMLRKASVKNDRYMPYGKGSVEVKSENEDGTKSTTSTILTENGLAGIPVDSGGNYTDQDGQQWICDEIVKYEDGSGEKIQRIGIFENYNSEEVTGAYISTTGNLSTGARVIYQMSEPVITPITSEQLAEIEKLYTFYPVTNIFNDSDAGMRVKYKADAKSYIDNRLLLIERAILNSI